MQNHYVPTIELETERLNLVVLTPSQFDLWVHNLPQLEQELGCSYEAEAVDGMFKEILQEQLEITKEDCSNYEWHSFWFIIRKTDRKIIGSADFKDIPNENGEVEIGYGLGKEFEHQGYMTETVMVMCDWAEKQNSVKHIIAETDLDGFASQHILQRCGFIEYKRGETIWWRK